MANDSTTAGYLAPSLPGPIYNEELEDVFHDMIVGITSLLPAMVRPRVQPDPPNQPGFDTAWCAFGVSIMESDWTSYQRHDPSGIGNNTQERDEVIHVLCSFYGPRYQELEAILRDGLQVEQNRAPLAVHKIKLVEVLAPVQLPALLKERWVRRIDARIVFRRRAIRSYQIRNLEGGPGSTLNNEQYVTPLDFTPPTP